MQICSNVAKQSKCSLISHPICIVTTMNRALQTLPHQEEQKMRMALLLMCPITVCNSGACSINSWRACVKYSMNTWRGLFSLSLKGPCFFTQPESSSKWVGSPNVSLHQHWSQVVALYLLQVPPIPCSSATCCICQNDRFHYDFDTTILSSYCLNTADVFSLIIKAPAPLHCRMKEERQIMSQFFVCALVYESNT